MKTIGLDIGTTTICAIVVDAENGEVLKSVTLPNDTFLENTKPFEKIQNPSIILDKALTLVDDLCKGYDDIVSIGVTGQMHGLVYLDGNGDAVSGLYIWQDASANEMYKDIQKYIDKAVSKGLIKSNTADRQKARLNLKVKNMK